MIVDRVFQRWLLVFPPVKGLTIAGAVVAVVHSELSPFAQALIIATISAVIGALGVIVAALIATAAADRAQRTADENTRHLIDLKAIAGIERRRGDPDPPLPPPEGVESAS